MNTKPNVDLIEAACAGDTDAVELLLRQYQPSITRFAAQYCAAADIEDAVQETLWTLYRKIGYLRTAQAFVSWTFQIVRHYCYRLLKRQQPTAMETDLIESMGQPGDDMLQRELQRDVVQALQALPLVYRQVLILRDLEGYTAPETAELLKMSVETVKSRLHRGRALMREQLAQWRPA